MPPFLPTISVSSRINFVKYLSLPPDPYLLPTAIKSCSSLPLGRQLHAIVCISGFSLDPAIASSLLHFYIRCHSLTDARHLFDQNPHKNIIQWSAMVSGYASHGLARSALSMLQRMKLCGAEPNEVTWNGIIAGFNRSGCYQEAMCALGSMHKEGFVLDSIGLSSCLPAIGNEEALSFGEQVHCYIRKVGFQSDNFVVSALIDMYGRCACTKEMLKVFDEFSNMNVASCNTVIAGLAKNSLVVDALALFKRFVSKGVRLNITSWTSIIACCVQNGNDMEALELFREMQRDGNKPNLVTIPCILPALGNFAALKHGKSTHCFSIRNDIIGDVYVGTALVDMYAKCGQVWAARALFDEMPERNVFSWNAMIGGYAMHGMGKEALELFKLMRKVNQKPDSITFICVLSACAQTGMTKEGRLYFKEMQGVHGIIPRGQHYACLVNLLGRAGELEEGYDLITKMPFEPDACIWGALLNSCRVHGNMHLGEIAAEKLFKLEPCNSGNYVILSNIYASKGMWAHMNSVRNKMKIAGLKKDLGCSWIEIKNEMHMLLAGDTSHPLTVQIMEKLQQISVAMKKLGYVHSENFVLQDVEEQEREGILNRHSEKLVVALGLVCTSSGTTLRVNTNLRICGDCHAWMKLVSKFERREIFVRDINRFHCFRDGTCSCGDYW